MNAFAWNPELDVICLHPETKPWKAGLCECQVCGMMFQDRRYLLGADVCCWQEMY